MTTRAARRTAPIDWLAIAQVAELGHRLHLLEPERSEVVRRLYGQIDPELLAWRLCITGRTVKRIATRLGLHTRAAPTSPESPLASHLAA